MSKSIKNMFAKLMESDDEDEGWTEVKTAKRAPVPAPPAPVVSKSVPKPLTVTSEPRPVTEHLGSLSGMSPDTPVPTGPWSFYFHKANSDEGNWSSLENFIKIGTIHTFGDMWAIFNSIADVKEDGTLEDKALTNGYFFLMCDPHPPMWEDSKNIRGGTYSLKIMKQQSAGVYIRYALAALLGQVSKKADNKIIGICISSKKDFNIINIWNEKSREFNNPIDDINIYTSYIGPEHIRYMPLQQKDFTFGSK